MTKVLTVLFVLLSYSLLAQSSEKYNSDYENYYRAEDLFTKEQYAAARTEFRVFIDGYNNPTDPFYVKANYYEAISALELYNNDAITLLKNFNKNYPESIYKQDIYFRLAKFYYRKKKYDDALAWFGKLSVQDIEEEDREEFNFKIGYANFKEEKFEEARSAFHEVKDGTSQYANPALYYYSHIAYQNESYQTALNGFLKLEDDEKFGKVVPYYIAQIYYLQGKYDKVTDYANKISGNGKIVNEKDMNHLIGDAYYRIGKYDEAVAYLEKYNSAVKTTREEDYRLGYSYYKTKAYKQAVRLFDRVKKGKDSLAQIAYYHIGECLLKMDNLASARSAFEEAAVIQANPIIEEDALYNYAIVSYKLDINPYDEAVEAFELYLNKYPDSKRKEDVYQYLVNVYMSTNNYDKALASLDKLDNKDIRLKTAYQLISYNQGVKFFQSANYPKAIQSFNKVKKYPVDLALSAKAIFWTAEANFKLKKFTDAIQHYKAFSVTSGNDEPKLAQEVHYNIGYAHLHNEDLEKSIEAFRIFTQVEGINTRKKADAYMRIADSYYILKENEQAIKHYNLVLKVKDGFEDRALFYAAKTYGYMRGHLEDKIKYLQDIINNHRQSKYIQISVFELAQTYKSLGKLDKALKQYRIIVFDYPASALVVDAKIEMADIYFKQGNNNKAEEEYLKILDKYGADLKVCEASTRGLIDIYKSTGHPENVEQLAAKYSCAKFGVDEQEDLYYEPAMTAYSDSAYEKAIPLFDKYLTKFPTGRYASTVINYQADCYYQTEDFDNAMVLYKKSLEGPNTGFTEMAAARVSHYLYSQGDFTGVIPYYERLEAVSSDPGVVFNAQLGLMRSNFLVENWFNAVKYADKILKANELKGELEVEAYYAKGMSSFYLKNYDNAKVPLVWLIKNTTTVKGAEARYTLAEMYFTQEYLDNSNDEITALLKQKPTYNYWVAKGLILRTRILILQNDLFQAEQTLKSVIDHYPDANDGILDEANELWNELMQLKDDQRAPDQDVNPIIEINDNEKKEGN